MNDASIRKVPPAIAVVFVNWNNGLDCIESLDSLLAQRYQNFDVFVVDNDSQDRSIEHIQAWCALPHADPTWKRRDGVDRWTDQEPTRPLPCRVVDAADESLPIPAEDCRITLIRSGGNLGFAGGCNVGIRCAGTDRFDYFWFLNTDTVVHRDALAALVERASRDTRVGMVGSTVRYYDRPDTVQALGGAYLEPASASSRHIGEGETFAGGPPDEAAIESRLAYIFGASMLVSSKLIREIGPMQEDYFLYFEEADWAIRSASRFTLAYASHSHVFHKSGASSTKNMPMFSANLYYRNRLRFMNRFFPQHFSAAKRSLFVDLLRFGCKRNWQMVRLLASILREADKIGADAIASAKYARS